MSKMSPEKIIRTTFFVWSLLLFSANICTKYLLFTVFPDFFLTHILISNLIPTALYLFIFLFLAIAYQYLPSLCPERLLLSAWGMILFVVLLQNMYVILSVPKDGTVINIIGFPIETLASIIGTFFSFLLTRKTFFKSLTFINLFIVLCLLFCTGFSIQFSLITVIKYAMHYSVLLICNLLGIGFLYKGNTSPNI